MARQDLNELFAQTSFLDGANAAYIEQLYAQYKKDPNSVDLQWQSFFAGLRDSMADVQAHATGASWSRTYWPVGDDNELAASIEIDPAAEVAADEQFSAEEHKEEKKAEPLQVTARGAGEELSEEEIRRATRDTLSLRMMIRAYRVRGHLAAHLDPLELAEQKDYPELDPASYGFTDKDLDRPIFVHGFAGLEVTTVRETLGVLRNTYCAKIGVEYMHIIEPEQRAWIQDRVEGFDLESRFTAAGKKAILNKLVAAECFESFLDKKYTGTKRFGLDGAEAAIPALEQIIKCGGQLNVDEIVLGMPHRGRLCVLANVMNKPFRAIFNEFKGGSWKPDDVEGSGDVKYHLGVSSDRVFDGNKVHLSLTANPSHLEIVDPVVLGKVRAKQMRKGDTERTGTLPLLLHGDAAFAGQGVVAECFGLSGLQGHRTGGSIHLIVNNQIGFTTVPIHSRSSPYPSDVARMIGAPILHVNGDDPEAVVHVARIATEFRQKFKKPVVIDMFCYRRFGHNEGDEPAFTQPLMYQKIRSHPKVVDIYAERLVSEGVISETDRQNMRSDFLAHLEEEFSAGDEYRPNSADWLDGAWRGIGLAEEGARRGDTGVNTDILKEVGQKLTTIPESVTMHKTIARLMKKRHSMIETGEGVDWAMAEALAFGTLVKEGYPVRLSGQDCERGTFSQRHSVIVDQETEDKYTPLNHVAESQGHFEVINSMLSEEAVLGFEYGYSLAAPDALVCWEAQFGDFANGAQVVIDQFISSGEHKWLRMSGLVLLLPHGYEGQGPEHSTARLERFLQLCAEDNWQIANCTSPANYFHILRRQLHRQFRKPLILMTPKSLLRHKRVLSRLDELGENTTFHRVLWDDAQLQPDGDFQLAPDKEIDRVVLCSGKVYYDLFDAREKAGANNIYIMRLEQLYPFPARALIEELSRFSSAEVIWCQEEPKNMGAWTYVEPNIEWVLDHINAKVKRPRYVGRAASASTATGLMSKHLAELKAFLDEALTL